MARDPPHIGYRVSRIGHRPSPIAQRKLFSNSSSIARLPVSWILRVPVPVKCGCVIVGTPCLLHSEPFQQNQLFFSSSNTHSGLLQSLANSAPHPVPPRTVPSSRMTPIT